jgi:hypothetical protein
MESRSGRSNGCWIAIRARYVLEDLCAYLDGRERTLKERIIENIGFATFSADHLF